MLLRLQWDHNLGILVCKSLEGLLVITLAKDFIHLYFGTDFVGFLFVYLFTTHTVDEAQDAYACHELSDMTEQILKQTFDNSQRIHDPS